MKKRLLLLLIALFSVSKVYAIRKCDPLLTFGAGYWDCRSHHAGYCVQAEYRFPCYYYKIVRPQAVIIFPRMQSAFIGLGLGLEFYWKHFVLIPSFTPGIYVQGNGRDLGFPLEFRSCMELSYQWHCGLRLGAQYFHISNASLANRNPGANTWIILFSVPLK